MADVAVPANEQATAESGVNLEEVAALQAERRKAKALADAKARKDAEARAKKEAEAEALAEKKRLAANPARIWVQMSAGRDVNALRFDLRRFRKKWPEQMGSKSGGWAQMGQTRRLVVGPFASPAKAKDFAAALRKEGADVMVWNSEAGEEVSLFGAP